jgi:hypothetical protein
MPSSASVGLRQAQECACQDNTYNTIETTLWCRDSCWKKVYHIVFFLLLFYAKESSHSFAIQIMVNGFLS